MTVIPLEFTIETSDSLSRKNNNEEEANNFLLNRREHNRYFINESSVRDMGKIIEISKGGLRIKKTNSEKIADSELTIPVFNKEIKANLVWQDNNHIGLRCTYEFDDIQLIKQNVKRIKEPETRPERIISDDDIAGITKRDVLSSSVNIMAELDTPDTDLTKLKMYVEGLSDASKEPDEQEKEESEEIDEIKESESVEPADLKEVLIHAANAASSSKRVEIKDLDFAIARLGLDEVKRISSNLLREEIARLEISLSNFDDYKSYTILKTVIFKNLTHFFNFNDDQGEGNLLLSLETKGIDILMSLSSKDSKDYYISPPRVYSEISRTLEKINFETDLLLVNKFYFDKKLGVFKDLYDGYILAHLNLNPGYTLSKNIKLTLTKRKLVFSLLASLTFVATKFIVDKDRESGFVLLNLLRKTGMDNSKIVDFLNECINKANNVLRDLGLKEKVRSVSLPYSSFKIEGYLPKDIHFKYFMKSLEDFSLLKSTKRMALRYEDAAYTHYILSKLISMDNFKLNSKLYCVIPCHNISDDELYLEDFFYFDLLFLKDIDRLPGSHIKDFVKLWNIFEGKIIVTFSTCSFLDFDNKHLYQFLKNHIVDFPSYFSNKEIYERMIDHTLDYLKPHTGEHKIDKNNYLSDFFSMDYIQTNELQSIIYP